MMDKVCIEGNRLKLCEPPIAGVSLIIPGKDPLEEMEKRF
jgi:hypothetical protein